MTANCPLENKFAELTETRIFVPKEEQKCRCDPLHDASDSTSDLTVEADGICRQCSLRFPDAFESLNQLSDILSLDEEHSFEEPTSSAFVQDRLLGTCLGDFEIRERIGSGGMARVYLAFDQVLKRHVAVKVIQNKKYLTRESQAELLQAEAISQASVHHPNVVSIFYVGRHETLPFLAMEYVDGYSLNDRVSEGPLSLREVYQCAEQIVLGLSEAYRNGLVHGDIKPANLLVDDNNVVKLSDFGLARHLQDDHYEPKQLVGTPSFMAPELFDKHAIDEQTDLFSLGVTLFQLTYGKSPYTLIGETAEEVKSCLEKASIEFPEDRPDVPERWINILRRLLAKKRTQRYSSIQQLESDLSSVTQSFRPAKPMPTITSLIVDNLAMFFLFIPLLTARIHIGFENLSGWLFGIMGPVAFFILCVWRQRSLGQLLTGIRPEVSSHTVRHQLLALLPTLLIVTGITAVSAIGASFGMTLVSVGFAISLCYFGDELITGELPTFRERAGRTRLVVDA